MTTEQKLHFLQHDFPAALEKIDPAFQPLFGKMTLQQMIEHFTDSVKIASGRQVHTEIISPADRVNKMQEFIMSDKPFRENTPNPLMGEMPPPVRHAQVGSAIAELRAETDYFIAYFKDLPDRTTLNPFFGDLDLEKNAQLLYKHALHHLRQFGVNLLAGDHHN